MERLPYIDEHAIAVNAAPAEAWAALLHTMCRDPGDPATVPIGFTLEEATPPRRLALKGRHWFAKYRLVFEVDPERDGVRLRALTFADFPGLRGTVYRALVIGSGGHRIVVRRMLRRVAANANGNRVCA
ncbi:SRPBCC family protein [Mycobacterium sp. ML4]